MLFKPGQGILPGLGGLLFDVALAGVVMKGVIDSGIEIHLMYNTGFSITHDKIKDDMPPSACVRLQVSSQ